MALAFGNEAKKFVVTLQRESQAATNESIFTPDSATINYNHSNPNSNNVPSYSFFPQSFNNYEGTVNIQHYSKLLRSSELNKDNANGKRSTSLLLPKISPQTERKDPRPSTTQQQTTLITRIKKSELLKQLPDNGSLVSLERRKSYSTTPNSSKMRGESGAQIESGKQVISPTAAAHKQAKKYNVLNMSTSDLIPRKVESKPKNIDKRIISGVKWKLSMSRNSSPSKREYPLSTTPHNDNVVVIGSDFITHQKSNTTNLPQEKKNTIVDIKVPDSDKILLMSSPRVRFVENVESSTNSSPNSSFPIEIVKLAPSTKRNISVSKHIRSVPNSGRKLVEIVAHSIPKSAPTLAGRKFDSSKSMNETPKPSSKQISQQKSSKPKLSTINLEASPNSNISAWTDTETNNVSSNPFFEAVETVDVQIENNPQDNLTIAHSQFSRIAQKKRLLVEQKLKDLNR